MGAMLLHLDPINSPCKRSKSIQLIAHVVFPKNEPIQFVIFLGIDLIQFMTQAKKHTILGRLMI